MPYYSIYYIVFEWCIDVIFLTDIFLTFHTAYKNEYDEVIDSYKDIFLNYISGYFIVDFISLVPLDLIFYITLKLNYDYNKFLKIFRVGKLH